MIKKGIEKIFNKLIVVFMSKLSTITIKDIIKNINNNNIFTKQRPFSSNLNSNFKNLLKNLIKGTISNILSINIDVIISVLTINDSVLKCCILPNRRVKTF